MTIEDRRSVTALVGVVAVGFSVGYALQFWQNRRLLAHLQAGIESHDACMGAVTDHFRQTTTSINVLADAVKLASGVQDLQRSGPRSVPKMARGGEGA